jgi:hypothetical protein
MLETDMEIPPDLLAFLMAGRQLQYEAADCEAGRVVLLSQDQLKVRLYPTDVDNGPIKNSSDPHYRELGCYLVPGVSLVAASDGFDPDGLLLWLPEENCYGTWDSSHTLLEAFDREVTWSHIANDPIRFINSFWSDERVGGLAPLVPWPKYQYDQTQPHWPRDPN